MDCPISRGTSSTLLPLNLSVPVCRMGKMKAHLPCAQSAPKEPCPRRGPGHCHGSLPTPLVPLLGWAPGHSG